MIQKNIKFGLFIFLAFVFFFISKLNISFLCGTESLSLTGSSIILPVLGSILGLSTSLIFIIGYFLIKNIISASALTFGLPSLFAAANWGTERICTKNDKNKYTKQLIAKIFLQVFIPLSCIMLFALHSVGQEALLYTLYWFIPVAIFLYQRVFGSSIFLVSLSSTFIAHAIGSVMALYLLAIPATTWLALIPLVAVERLVFASGATLIHYAVQKIVSLSIAKKQASQINI